VFFKFQTSPNNFSYKFDVGVLSVQFVFAFLRKIMTRVCVCACVLFQMIGFDGKFWESKLVESTKLWKG